jgi:DNA-binding NarL/FixJ family response regulator
MMSNASCQNMSNSPLILLIDDNPEEREYYTQLLRTSLPDSFVLHTSSGQCGLDFCELRPVDCVVLEIDLPDMSGFDVLQKLAPRVEHPEIAVIVLTRLSNQSLLEAAIEDGAQSAFHKTMVTADMLDTAVLKAISTVRKDRKRRLAA